MLKNLSVSVPIYGQWKYVQKLLQSIRKDIPPKNIILVDDRSPDSETREYLKSLSHKYTVFFNDENLGFPKTANKAVLASKTKYTVLVNSDVYIPAGQSVFQDCLKKIEKDKKIAVMGLLLLHDNKTIQHGGVYMDWDSQGGTPRHRFCGDEVTPKACVYEECDIVTGAFMVLRMDVFRKLHGFSTLFGRGYFEDPDYCIRARKAGYKIMYNGEVWAYHYGHKSFENTNYPYSCTPYNLKLFQRRQLEWLKKNTVSK